MAVKVRRAVPDDVEKIAGFAFQLFAQHRGYDPERFADLGNIEGAKWFYGSRIDAADAALLIAEDDGEPVGFAYLEYEAQNYADLLESVVWLHDIYLVADARGQGTGKKLIDACAKAAEQLGADKLVLHVAARNAVGQDFFERAGFRTTMHEMMLGLGELAKTKF